MTNDIPTFPVVGWDVGHAPNMNLVLFIPRVLRPDATQGSDTDPLVRLAFAPQQVRLLIGELQTQLAMLESGGSPPSGSPRH